MLCISRYISFKLILWYCSNFFSFSQPSISVKMFGLNPLTDKIAVLQRLDFLFSCSAKKFTFSSNPSTWDTCPFLFLCDPLLFDLLCLSPYSFPMLISSLSHPQFYLSIFFFFLPLMKLIVVIFKNLFFYLISACIFFFFALSFALSVAQFILYIRKVLFYFVLLIF